MSRPIITIQGIGKRYRIGAVKEPYLSLRDEVAKWLSPAARRARAAEEEFWALKDVTFSVEPGEAIGIIGRNGAGKSTLLKILSQITPPTEGKITMRGRVGSLLEVGTGFHPELSGRENIYMNGAILGMSRREIARKFDEIVAFAEMEKFLDTPVKRYSNGMYVRLAFAVAAHLEPEILVIDEVLAVGDAQFQKKCLGKMGEAAKHGRTVLFVSHNMEAIQAICPRAILLSQGRVAKAGASADAVARYLARDDSAELARTWEVADEKAGTEEVRMRRVAIEPCNDDGSRVITVCTPLRFECEYWNLVDDALLHLSVHIFNERGVEVINALPAEERVWNGRPLPRGLFRSVFQLPGNLLNDGSYHVDVHVVKDLKHPILQLDTVVTFEVEDNLQYRGSFVGKWYGVVRPRLQWTTERVSEEMPDDSPR